MPVSVSSPGTKAAATLTDRLVLAAAIVSSIALMVPVWFAGPLVLDEHVSYWVIDSQLPSTVWERSLEYTAIPPLSSWVQQFSLYVLGKSEFALRLSSLVFAVAAVGVTYLAGRTVHSPMCGAIAALILAWHPEAVDEVRIGRCYGQVLFFAAAVLHLTWLWMDRPESRGLAVLWGLTAAALMWTHYTTAPFILIAGAIVGLRAMAVIGPSSRNADAVRHDVFVWLLGMAITAASAVPLLMSVLRIVEWGPLLNFSGAEVTVAGTISPFWWAGLPAGCVGAYLSIARLRAGRIDIRQTSGVMLLLAALSLVPILIPAVLALGSGGELSSLANPRYRIAYAPAAAVLASLLLLSIGRRRGAIVGTAVLLAVAWSLSDAQPWQLQRLGAPTAHQWKQVNEHLGKRAADGDPVVVQSGLVESRLVSVLYDDPLFLEFAACRAGRFYLEQPHPRWGLPYVWHSVGVVERYRRLFRNWADEGRDVWLAAATDTDLNLNSIARMQEIAAIEGYGPVEHREWPDAVVVRFVPEAATATDRTGGGE